MPECETFRYLPPPDDMLALDIAYTIYMKFGDLASALRIALQLDKVSSDYLMPYVLFKTQNQTNTCLTSVADAICEASLHFN